MKTKIKILSVAVALCVCIAGCRNEKEEAGNAAADLAKELCMLQQQADPEGLGSKASPSISVEKVDVQGDKATVELSFFEGSEKVDSATAELKKVNGEWMPVGPLEAELENAKKKVETLRKARAEKAEKERKEKAAKEEFDRKYLSGVRTVTKLPDLEKEVYRRAIKKTFSQLDGNEASIKASGVSVEDYKKMTAENLVNELRGKLRALAHELPGETQQKTTLQQIINSL